MEACEKIRQPTGQEYRNDGWPLCVRCGEDELYSMAGLHYNGTDTPPSLAEHFASEFGCYGCLWQGKIKPKSD